MIRGLFTALIAMALWGLIFVLPLFVPEFSSFEISMGRFVVYGVTSLAVLFVKTRGNFKLLPLEHWKLATLFALSSSLVYYFFIVIGIRNLGAPFATALCSLLPISMSIYGNYFKKIFDWKTLFLPLCLLFLGLFFMHYQDLAIESSGSTFAIGLVAILSAVLMWCWYSIHNADFLSNHPEVSPSDWSSFIGIVCLIGGVGGFLAAFLTMPDACYFTCATGKELFIFSLVSIANGFGASWMTLFLWNRASRVVPMALLGQMSVFEVLFGLGYVYLKNQSLPSSYELAGIGLIAGALMISFRRASKLKSA